MVFMPSDVTGKDRKLAHPYHGPFRIICVTPTNAEVQLIERPHDQSIFYEVAMERLRKCYPEQTNDCWTGWKGKRIRRKCQLPKSTSPVKTPRTTGSVTRSMAQRLND